MSGHGFLGVPVHTAEAQLVFDEDISEVGHVMNVSRLWAYQPALLNQFFDLIRQTATTYGLSMRHRGILVAACASAIGDSYCSLAWGTRLAAASDAQTAAGVLRGDDEGLTSGERVMAEWARKIARNPNATTAADVKILRDAGYSDDQIFGTTVFVGLRIAFSTINDALGARPDVAFLELAPASVLDAVDFGRAIDDGAP